MKVLEAISDGNIGGAGVLLLSRLKNSDRDKIETTVIIPKESLLIERFKKIGVEVYEIDCYADRSFDVTTLLALIVAIRKIKPDIINTHGWLSVRIAAAVCKVPIRVYTRHCAFPVPKTQKSFVGKAFFRAATCILSNHIVAVADAAKDNLVEMGASPKDITVIINGCEGLNKTPPIERYNLRSKLGIDKDAVVLGINARLETYKGHECLLRAVKILNCSYRDKIKVVCLIIGDGSQRESLKRKCREYNIENLIIFTGFLQDVSPYMNIVDINVNCSTGTETSSLSLSEGMSLAIPSVASDFGGNPYMVKDGVNGFIFPQNNSEALAEKIFLLASDKELYQRMSYEAQKRFYEELNAKNMTKRTENLYCSLFHATKNKS